MKKGKRVLTIMLILALATIAFIACGGVIEGSNEQYLPNASIPASNENPENPTTQPASSQTSDLTIEDFRATIIAAGTFWADWWQMRGAFAWENIEHIAWDYWVEQPEHPRSKGFDRLLPASGFEHISDVRDYLLQFYTETWVDEQIFGEGTALAETGGLLFGAPIAYSFAEYDGHLYVQTTRIGMTLPMWETATHTLVEQDGNRAVVETIVTAYDHWGSGDDMPSAKIRFTFIGGRIDSGVGTWQFLEPSPMDDHWVYVLEDRAIFTFFPSPISVGEHLVVRSGTVVNFTDNTGALFTDAENIGARFGFVRNLMLDTPDFHLWEEALFADAPRLSEEPWDYDLTHRLREYMVDVPVGSGFAITLTDPGFYIVGLEGEYWFFVEVAG